MASPIRACTFGSLKGSSRSRGASSPENMTSPDLGGSRSFHFCSAARRRRRGHDSRGSAPAFLASSETAELVRLLFMALWIRRLLMQGATPCRARPLGVSTAPGRGSLRCSCLVQRKNKPAVPLAYEAVASRDEAKLLSSMRSGGTHLAHATAPPGRDLSSRPRAVRQFVVGGLSSEYSLQQILDLELGCCVRHRRSDTQRALIEIIHRGQAF